jgi:hypothetical protein
MSRVLDFRDLRERILAGEEEDDLEPIEDTPLQIEGGDGITLIPLCLSAGVLVYLGYESYQNAKGSPTLFSDSIRNMILVVGGVLPLGFGIGRLSRGLSAQKDNKKYDRLLDEADAKIEALEEEALNLKVINWIICLLMIQAIMFLLLALDLVHSVKKGSYLDHPFKRVFGEGLNK